MGMKKLFGSIAFIFVLIVGVFSLTSAYLAIVTNEEDVSTGSGMLDIDYTKPGNLTGQLRASIDRSTGLMTFAKASLKVGSEKSIFNMYIIPTALTNLNIPALKWEAEGIRDGQIICSNSGDFSSAVVGEPMKLFVNDINDNIDDCVLSMEETTFNIYVWLDINLVDTAINGTNFGAKISADSVPITGGF